MECLSTQFWFSTLFIASTITLTFTSGILSDKKHQTNASLEKMNDLTCFNCNSLFNTNCENITKQNNTFPKLYSKCKGEKRSCMVKRYSYSMSSENSTTKIKVWALERNCSSKCEEGCIVIGERTKLYACTTCCNTNYCNVGNHAASLRLSSVVIFFSSGSLLCLWILPFIFSRNNIS